MVQEGQWYYDEDCGVTFKVIWIGDHIAQVEFKNGKKMVWNFSPSLKNSWTKRCRELSSLEVELL
jgi:hypothetical protein